MAQAPAFFLPPIAHYNASEQDAAYLLIAEKCGRPVPAQRVYSITFRQDSDFWTATVGEKLTGSKTQQVGPTDPTDKTDTTEKTDKTDKIDETDNSTDETTRLSDAATVVAIFPGTPYLVVTDSGIISGGRTNWENPFYAPMPTSVTYFSS
jgi:hypothetical protein